MSNKSINKLDKASSDSKNWLELPPEMRAWTIEKMDGKTLCRYSQCSILSRAEVRKSRIFMSKLLIDECPSLGHYDLSIFHGSKPFNYKIKFIDVHRHNWIPKLKDQTVVLHIIESKKDGEDEGSGENGIVKKSEIVDGKARDLRNQYAFNHCEKYENNIRNITIRGNSLDGINLKCLKKLEKIDINLCRTDVVKAGIFDLNQLMNVPILESKKMVFTYDEFLLFNGKVGHISMEIFEEKLLTQYLQLLQTTEVHKNVKFLSIIITGSNNQIPSFEYIKTLQKHWKVSRTVTSDYVLVQLKISAQFRIYISYFLV